MSQPNCNLTVVLEREIFYHYFNKKLYSSRHTGRRNDIIWFTMMRIALPFFYFGVPNLFNFTHVMSCVLFSRGMEVVVLVFLKSWGDRLTWMEVLTPEVNLRHFIELYIRVFQVCYFSLAPWAFAKHSREDFALVLCLLALSVCLI